MIIWRQKKIPAKTLILFTRQLSTLLQAGLPLWRALEILEQQERSPAFKHIIATLMSSLQQGHCFSNGLASYPHLFNSIYVAMVQAGEIGGILGTVLERLADFQERAQRIKNKITTTLYYPVFVLAITILLLGFLLTFIVPKFQDIFATMLDNKPLPLLTELLIQLSQYLRNHFVVIGIMFLGAFFLLRYLRCFLPCFLARSYIAPWTDSLLLKLPLLGELTHKSHLAHLSKTLGTLLHHGVPILQAVSITQETISNTSIKKATANFYVGIKEGDTMSGCLQGSPLFPAMLVGLVRVGEETGKLPIMLLKIAALYEEEVEQLTTGLLSLLEPCMILLLALMVGAVVIALFLPLMSMMGDLSLE